MEPSGDGPGARALPSGAAVRELSARPLVSVPPLGRRAFAEAAAAGQVRGLVPSGARSGRADPARAEPGERGGAAAGDRLPGSLDPVGRTRALTRRPGRNGPARRFGSPSGVTQPTRGATPSGPWMRRWSAPSCIHWAPHERQSPSRLEPITTSTLPPSQSGHLGNRAPFLLGPSFPSDGAGRRPFRDGSVTVRAVPAAPTILRG